MAIVRATSWYVVDVIPVVVNQEAFIAGLVDLS
jgi:hypothetical protein